MLCAEDRIDTAFFPYEPGSPGALIHNDHLGTPQKMTDSTGTVVWSADYKPFGEVNITINTITNNLGFPGQYYDAETGLCQNVARTYGPSRGAYIESDPMGLEKGNNHIYVYAGNNPIMRTDIWGLMGAKGDKLPEPLFTPPNKLPCGKNPDQWCGDKYRDEKLPECRGNTACIKVVREWLHLCLMWANGLDSAPEKCPPRDCPQ